EIHSPVRPRMSKPKLPRMQHLPRESSGLPPTVNTVAEDRMSEMLKMHANLMSPAAVQPALEEAGIVSGAHDLEIGARFPPAFAPGPGMDQNPSRLVEHDQVLVFEQNRERDLFRHEIDRFSGRLDKDDPVAHSNHVARTRDPGVYRDMTLLDQPLNARTGEFR